MEKQWYIVYTKPRTEKKVSDVLTRKNIENYFPLNRVASDWNANKKIIEVPLFTCYIFVRATVRQLFELKKITGVVNLVYWLGKPVIIDDSEISMIKSFLSDHINVTTKKITLGIDTLRKYDTSIVEQEGSLMTVKNKKINVVLPSLGYIMTAEVETSNVRIISSANLIRRPKVMSGRLFNPVQSFSNFFKN
jgi:transcription antitermination factor NusG